MAMREKTTKENTLLFMRKLASDKNFENVLIRKMDNYIESRLSVSWDLVNFEGENRR